MKKYRRGSFRHGKTFFLTTFSMRTVPIRQRAGAEKSDVLSSVRSPCRALFTRRKGRTVRKRLFLPDSSYFHLLPQKNFPREDAKPRRERCISWFQAAWVAAMKESGKRIAARVFSWSRSVPVGDEVARAEFPFSVRYFMPSTSLMS